jgi:quinol monooxygenase YgiN
MPVRLVITTYAKPGKGAALAQAMADRCRAVQQEPGCQQFEIFQSALDPDKLVVLELWTDQAALDVHAQVNGIVNLTAPFCTAPAWRGILVPGTPLREWECALLRPRDHPGSCDGHLRRSCRQVTS